MDRTRKFRNARHFRLCKYKWNGDKYWEQFETREEADAAALTYGGRPEAFDRKTGRWVLLRLSTEG